MLDLNKTCKVSQYESAAPNAEYVTDELHDHPQLSIAVMAMQTESKSTHSNGAQSALQSTET